jgi:hypothetical protein
MNRSIDEDLQALHVEAARDGRCAQVLCAGDAEGLLWSAPRRRVVQRSVRIAGSLVSELRVLLDPDGRPLAWWQRSAAAAWPPGAWPLPATIAHRSVHEITLAPGAPPIDGALRALCIDAFIDRLAAAAGRDALAYRHAGRPRPLSHTTGAASPGRATRADARDFTARAL